MRIDVAKRLAACGWAVPINVGFGRKSPLAAPGRIQRFEPAFTLLPLIADQGRPRAHS